MDLRESRVRKYFELRLGKVDETFEKVLDTDLELLRRRARNLGLVPKDIAEKPVQLMIPDHFLDEDIKYRLDEFKGGSNLRYSQAAVTTLFYDDKRLYYHQCNLDVMSGVVYDDVAGEFKFEDVVTVETFLSYGAEDDPNHVRLDVELQLNNGSELLLTLRRHPLTEDYEREPLLTEEETMFLTLVKGFVRK